MLALPNNKWHFVAWEKDLRDRKTFRLYDHKYLLLDRKLTPDRCSHRGASLSTGTFVDGCVKCPYHGRRFSPHTTPDLFGGVIRDGALWYGGEDPEEIPAIPEFQDPSYRTVYMSRRLRDVSPLAFLEAGLDFEHVKSVHSLSVADIIPPSVDIDRRTNTNVHVFDTPRLVLRIDTQFWLPLTNCLKFHLHDKVSGRDWKPFILWFSMTPHGPRDMTLHVRSMRQKTNQSGRGPPWTPDLDLLLDVFFKGISDVPVFEDARVVRTVDVRRMFEDALTPEDDFIACYREQMVGECPHLLEYFLEC